MKSDLYMADRLLSRLLTHCRDRVLSVYTVCCLKTVPRYCISHRRRVMYIGHALLRCVSVRLTLAAFPHYCTDSDVTWRNGRSCPLVVQCSADLQSVHGFRCYDNIAPNAKCQRVLVLAVCLVLFFDYNCRVFLVDLYTFCTSRKQE